MAAFKKTKVVDGFSVVQSLAQIQKEGKMPAPSPKSQAPPPDSARPKPPGPNPHLGKTVQPTKRTIRCFNCGLEFKLAGTTREIYCSKCRTKIDLKDYEISGVWKEEIQTGGRVMIRPGARLEGVKVLAGMILMEGTMDADSYLESTQWLEIGAGVKLEPRQITMRNLRVGAGAEVRVPNRLFVHHLEVLGLLEADIEATGLVSIREGGEIRGSIKAEHLQVEEGGGLNARLFIWPKPSA